MYVNSVIITVAYYICSCTAQSHSDDSHVNATAPCISCTYMYVFALCSGSPPMSCIPLVSLFLRLHHCTIFLHWVVVSAGLPLGLMWSPLVSSDLFVSPVVSAGLISRDFCCLKWSWLVYSSLQLSLLVST